MLVVEDTGDGFGKSAAAGTGVGLAHVKERLAAVYGDTASMETGRGSETHGGVRITLRLPLSYEAPRGNC